MDPDSDPDPTPDPDVFVSDLYDDNKKNFKSFFAYYFLKLHLHKFSKIKSHKNHKTVEIMFFSYYFCLIIEGSGSVSHHADPGGPKTYGSCGSGSATLQINKAYWYPKILTQNVLNSGARIRHPVSILREMAHRLVGQRIRIRIH
jgi:hypothetical protein